MVPVEAAFCRRDLFTVAHARASAETYWSDVTQWLRLSNGVKPYCGLRETSVLRKWIQRVFCIASPPLVSSGRGEPNHAAHRAQINPFSNIRNSSAMPHRLWGEHPISSDLAKADS
jgi:hypothetical protein